MAEAKHTPGPWQIVSEGLQQHARAAFNPWLRILIGTPKPEGSGDAVITQRFVATITDHAPDEAAEKESRANAQLIVAAPDMLAALKWVRTLYRPNDESDMVKAIDAAIAKATAPTARGD